MKKIGVILAVIVAVTMTTCNDGLSSTRDGGKNEKKRDRSQRTVIDKADYVDFTVAKHNAKTVKKEDILHALNSGEYRNGNSVIKIKAHEGQIEVSSDSGYFNGKENCQIYGIYQFDIQAASEDCLYIRKDQKKPGFIMIDGYMFRDDAVPDLAACLPLYGYSRNRIEVSSVMDGYIVMPSGTYWKN